MFWRAVVVQPIPSVGFLFVVILIIGIIMAIVNLREA